MFTEIGHFAFQVVGNIPDFFPDGLFYCLSVFLILHAFLFPAQRRQACVLDSIIVACLVFLAAWPIFPVPFTTDAAILRHAFAAADVTADWNHPFLGYLLNKPAAMLSMNPAVVRITPFIWALAEVMIFAHVARISFGGRRAAAIVSVWMAAAIRQSYGMVDISDWNLAGCFLGGMVWWLVARRAAGNEGEDRRSDQRSSVFRGFVRRQLRFVVPAALMVSGVYSSWLMIVPSAVLAAVTAMDCRRTKSWQGWWLVAAAMLVPGFQAAGVFFKGGQAISTTAGLPWYPFFRELFTVAPFGLAVAIPFLFVWGLVPATKRLREPAILFCVMTIAAVFAAVLTARAFSTVNGAYYVSLAHGPIFLVAAMGVVAVVEALEMRGPGAGTVPDRRSVVVRRSIQVGLASVIIILSVRLSPEVPGSGAAGSANIPAFIKATESGKFPVFSNIRDTRILFLYDDVRAGRINFRQLLDTYLMHFAEGNVHYVDRGDDWCPGIPTRFMVLWHQFEVGSMGGIPSCWKPDRFTCAEMWPPKDDGIKHNNLNLLRFFDCRAAGEANHYNDGQNTSGESR